jgi:hypothetical protein
MSIKQYVLLLATTLSCHEDEEATPRLSLAGRWGGETNFDRPRLRFQHGPAMAIPYIPFCHDQPYQSLLLPGVSSLVSMVSVAAWHLLKNTVARSSPGLTGWPRMNDHLYGAVVLSALGECCCHRPRCQDDVRSSLSFVREILFIYSHGIFGIACFNIFSWTG